MDSWKITMKNYQKSTGQCWEFAELYNGIPSETVKEFELSLDKLGIENDIAVYPGVNHASQNPSGDRYTPEEPKDAWQKTLSFFENNLITK